MGKAYRFMKDNVVQSKSFQYSVRIIKLFQYLVKEKKEFEISKQLLRSGTFIGANIEEAIGAPSKKDFIAKLSISFKEARETHYWLRLLKATEYINSSLADSLILDCEELLKLITSIQKKSKINICH